MAQTDAIVSVPWYRTLNRDQWRVLIASNLGWAFDGFEIYALFLTVAFALHQLLDAAQYAAIPRYAGYILATTVFGWATGGVIGGIIADYIGRKRGTVNLSGSVSRMAGGLAVGIGVYCQPMQQISAQTRNFWALEALCSAAVT
jgi:MFS family permease